MVGCYTSTQTGTIVKGLRRSHEALDHGCPRLRRRGGGIYDIEKVFLQEELLQAPRHRSNIANFMAMEAGRDHYNLNDVYL